MFRVEIPILSNTKIANSSRKKVGYRGGDSGFEDQLQGKSLTLPRCAPALLWFSPVANSASA